MKKSILFVIALIVVIASFAGCDKTEPVETPVASEPASSSEVPSEEVSSEEVSEEASSEEVTVSFSADEVMKHIDELTAEYQYNNPEHIKALVIAANLDYISAEDLDMILNTYGYTIEDLAALYDECILDAQIPLDASFDYSQGNLDSLTPEQTYEKRIKLSDAIIDEDAATFAKPYDDMLVNRSNGISIMDEDDKFAETVMNMSEFTNLESFVYSYTCGVLHKDISYTDFIPNPYVNYQSAN